MGLKSPKIGRGVINDRIAVKKLRVNAVALRYLDVLLDHPMSLSIRSAGRVSIPSMPAFFVHKLLVAPRRPPRSAGKKEKDYRQVHAVAQRILSDFDLVDQTSAVLREIPAPWVRRARASAAAMEAHLEPGRSASVALELLDLALDSKAPSP